MIALVIYKMACRWQSGSSPTVSYGQIEFKLVLQTLFEVAHEVNGLGLHNELRRPMLVLV